MKKFDTFDAPKSTYPVDIKDGVRRPGRVVFDSRGNAVFEWHDDKLLDETDQAEQKRFKALTKNLSLADDDIRPGVAFYNARGVNVGYNPYDSGRLAAGKGKKKPDLRELSAWIVLKRKMTKSVK